MNNDQPKPSRRGFFFGAVATGAAAAAVVALPGVQAPQAIVEVPKPAPENGGGYDGSSKHVQHYYRTTRI